jgi:hypothetical protein
MTTLPPTTPMVCPVCDGPLEWVEVRDLGGVTADLVWQLHAGHCPDHGWFQAEVVSRPPREIFAVDRPFGSVQRLIVDDLETYSFPTVWGVLANRRATRPGPDRRRADPLDARYWRTVRPDEVVYDPETATPARRGGLPWQR